MKIIPANIKDWTTCNNNKKDKNVKRCSLFVFTFQLFVGRLVSYLRCLCLF